MAEYPEPTIRVSVGNYGYYAEGELRDAVLALPVEDDGAIREWLAAHGLYDGLHEEVYISDYIDGVPRGCSELFGEHTGLSDLNLLSKQMQAYPEQAARIYECLEAGIDAPDDLLGLMNWIAQAGDFPFYSYCYEHMGNLDEWGHPWDEHISAEEKMGWTLLEGQPALRSALDECDAWGAFDVERYGKKNSHYCTLCDTGYIDKGQDFPDEDFYSREEIAEDIEAELSRAAAGAAGFASVQEAPPDLAADLEAAAARAERAGRREPKQMTR